jgi:hypothetical protein
MAVGSIPTRKRSTSSQNVVIKETNKLMVNIKLPLCFFIEHHALKAYWGAFLIWALDES